MAETGGVAVLSSFLSVAIETLTDRDHRKFLEHRKINGLIQELKTKMIALSSIVDAAEEKQFANEAVRKWLLELKDATYAAEDVLDGIQIEYQACQSKAGTEDQPTTNKGGKLGNLACCIPIFVKRSSSSQGPLKREMEPKLQEILDRLEDLWQKSNAFGLRKAVGSIEFDVFLNFRGDDVRYSFLYYLKDALQEENIKTFYDEEDVTRGENVAAILEKIEVSKMSVIIFSKDYASSSFCLKELVKILECKKRWGHKAFPVFYNVDPKVVAKQSGSYKEAFRKHENEKGTDSEEVRTWRASLAEAAAIAGQHLQNKRPEKIDIRQTVKAVKKILAEFDSEKRSSDKRENTSLIDEFEGFYGRDADKKAIIDMLISDDDKGNKPGVIPIVGMGGVGKTTLAQHVYNDKAVAEQFKVRAWVCVSDQFDVTKVTREIVKNVTEGACPGDDLDQLQRNLKGALDGKTFLLVLDDVWGEDYGGWNKLLIPLRSGAKGSKIIVTTRTQKVASKVQTVPTHHLRKLEDEDCWKLFARHASYDVNSTASHPELEAIGKEIVRKCGGLPLAAKALGGVLRWETNAEKWKEVLKSEIWDVENANILPALAMSYIRLPLHLKRCFAYCAIFPQDYEFQKKKLVDLWMSEGFLIQQRGNQSLEERGDTYFDDLVSRSFFQPEDDYFVMHDLVHDLARFVSGEFCSGLECGTSWNVGERSRHLFCEKIEEDVVKKFQGIHETPFLRSSILSECFDEGVSDGLLLRWKLLRVLSLSGRGITKLPNSIGNLKCMRHLDISWTLIILLPEAVTGLFNLEILILQHCEELVELPADMARLINLCQLDLRGTTRLKGMPPEMGKLKKLSQLTDFIVGKNGGSSIKQLSHLHCLRGQISISELQNVEDDRDASEVILKDKENLKVLQLGWKRFADYSRQAAVKVLKRLQPHPHIECIEILYYGGRKFPNWVGGISFSKLKKMVLQDCRNCICLPPLGQLVSLEELSIRGGDDDDLDYYGDGDYNEVLEAIGAEFYRKCKPGEKPFSSLKRLKFVRMRKWREWSSCNGAFPVLEELELRYCRQLMSVPSHLPNLKRLRIEDCGEVTCMSLETFPNLKELNIRECSNLESLVGSTAAAAAATTTTTGTTDLLFCLSLTSLSISRCSKLVSFPRGGLRGPNLKSMEIYQCFNLKLLPQGMHSFLPSLEELKIFGCPKIEFLPEEGLPASLSSLSISGCPLLKKRCEWEKGEDWPKIKHLPHLQIFPI